MADSAIAETILSTPDQGWIMLVGVALSFGYTSRLLYAHAEPHIWYDRIDGWVLGLCFGFLPHPNQMSGMLFAAAHI